VSGSLPKCDRSCSNLWKSCACVGATVATFLRLARWRPFRSAWRISKGGHRHDRRSSRGRLLGLEESPSRPTLAPAWAPLSRGALTVFLQGSGAAGTSARYGFNAMLQLAPTLVSTLLVVDLHFYSLRSLSPLPPLFFCPIPGPTLPIPLRFTTTFSFISTISSPGRTSPVSPLLLLIHWPARSTMIFPRTCPASWP